MGLHPGIIAIAFSFLCTQECKGVFASASICFTRSCLVLMQIGRSQKKALRSQGDGHQGHTTSATTLTKPCKSTCYLKVTRTHHWMIYTEMHVCPMYMYIMLIHGGVYVYSTYTQWCVHRNFQSSTEQDNTIQNNTMVHLIKSWCYTEWLPGLCFLCI